MGIFKNITAETVIITINLGFILEEVRRLRNRKKSVNVDSNKEELLYVNR